MREVKVSDIVDAVREASIKACCDLPADVINALKKAKETETSPQGVAVLDELIENQDIASQKRLPICQDTGFAVVFVELGRNIVLDGDLYSAINEAIKQGYKKGCLRKSIVKHPLERINTTDNTPAVIHVELTDSDKLDITIAPKGGGSENMSAAAMLTPAEGKDGVIKFIVDQVKKAGSNPCPPIILGIGLGGTLEKACLLSKKALLRNIGSVSNNPIDAELEEEIFREVNKTGIGPAGLGGNTTALAVHVESFPCHIASLPLAVNISCHAARHVKLSL
ncbi:MAG: fumarate hydratase [Armatimonadota bacterium]